VLYTQIRSLAAAVSALPHSWPQTSAGTNEALAEFLGISGEEGWFAEALREAIDCQPPVHELSTWTHGVAVIRWLLHRILPYPCFLLDGHHLARRLHSTPSSVVGALNRGGELADALRPYEYGGVLAGFLGSRWWRSGITAFLDQLGDDAAAGGLVAREFGLELVVIDEPVVSLDDEYRTVADLIDVSETVTLQLDDWPPYAEHPYARIDSARTDQRLRNLVHPRDRGMLA